MRALPSGPTPVDMMANTAFLLGLTESFKKDVACLTSSLPFIYAEKNFYRVARFGLDAHIVWPSSSDGLLDEQPVSSLLANAVDRSEEGLLSVGVAQQEIDHYLGIVRARLERKFSPSCWIRDAVEDCDQNADRRSSLQKITNRYIELAATGQACHDWPAFQYGS